MPTHQASPAAATTAQHGAAHAADAGHSPLAQFEIKPLFDLYVSGYNLSFTNAALFMVVASLLATALMTLTVRKSATVPGRLQMLSEMLYEFVANMLSDIAGPKGKQYFPFVFSVFIFVLMCNLIGMIPYSFTVTSHIIVTFALAITAFLIVTLTGFVKHGLHFLAFFLPKGTPVWMAPLMIFIELFSYLARPLSLSVRLAANMMAGHTMLKIIAGFVVALSWWGGWMPLAMLVVLTGFEIFVAVLQAYIFAILVCVYLNDAINLH